MTEKSQLKITILGYDVGTVEEATKSIMQQIKQPKKNYIGPIPFPTRRKLISLITSPHKHKSSQEQFERKTHIHLKVVKAYENDIAANLNIFSNLTKLQKLDLALKNCKDLEYLCIGYQPNIKGGLEYLPAAKLTYFAHPELMAKVKHPEREKANYRIELEEEIAEKENLIN
ncbi:10564_t:CDS:2 [Racocetra persica]|uniref:10564_t:CDS:1 n=1 Tax=Racocetra persica TaxID=160502 RepID=A0ACA9QDZ8_9GLOM|nr:10564_t:CDS:2 [Racocetra persica]